MPGHALIVARAERETSIAQMQFVAHALKKAAGRLAPSITLIHGQCLASLSIEGRAFLTLLKENDIAAEIAAHPQREDRNSEQQRDTGGDVQEAGLQSESCYRAGEWGWGCEQGWSGLVLGGVPGFIRKGLSLQGNRWRAALVLLSPARVPADMCSLRGTLTRPLPEYRARWEDEHAIAQVIAVCLG